jgi:hypothetical protein
VDAVRLPRRAYQKGDVFLLTMLTRRTNSEGSGLQSWNLCPIARERGAVPMNTW